MMMMYTATRTSRRPMMGEEDDITDTNSHTSLPPADGKGLGSTLYVCVGQHAAAAV